MRMGGVAGGLLLGIVISSSASSRTWSGPALQRTYFAKVAQISRGVVRPLKDENTAILSYDNAIFEVDLEGNGSKYVASYGKTTIDIRSPPPGLEISHILEIGEPSKVIKKGELVILMLNNVTGRLTIMPGKMGEIRPLRWNGKNRFIPYGTDCASMPRDRDAISVGDSGSTVVVYRYRKGWKLRWCEVA